MTQNEIELLNIVRENDNPTQTIITVIEIIISCLEQP